MVSVWDSLQNPVLGAWAQGLARGRSKFERVLQSEHIGQVYLATVLELRHFDVKNITQKEGRHPPGAVRGRRDKTAIEPVDETVKNRHADCPTRVARRVAKVSGTPVRTKAPIAKKTGHHEKTPLKHAQIIVKTHAGPNLQ